MMTVGEQTEIGLAEVEEAECYVRSFTRSPLARLGRDALWGEMMARALPYILDDYGSLLASGQCLMSVN